MNNQKKQIPISSARKINENLTVLTKFACYDGNGSSNIGLEANRTKLWVEMTFKL